jgi:DNA-binding NtrC family response regulator
MSMRIRSQAETVDNPAGTALIVEPAAAMARLLRRMAEELGFHVIEAKGPDDALALIENSTTSIDVVVSELSLPEVSGSKLASFVSASRPATPVVLLCDLPLPDTVQAGPGVAFLPKPFTRDQLARMIGHLSTGYAMSAPRTGRSCA